MKNIISLLCICIFLSACSVKNKNPLVFVEENETQEVPLALEEVQEVTDIVTTVIEETLEDITPQQTLSFTGREDKEVISPVTKLPETKQLSEDEKLRLRLTDLQYEVTQNGQTETPYKNLYWNNYEEGIYVDIIDGTALFSSIQKYDTKTGWPSFSSPISESVIEKRDDTTLWFKRTEVLGKKSSAHLGHVFNDGPKEQGGLRYCLNSAALLFIAKEDMAEQGYKNYLYLFE